MGHSVVPADVIRQYRVRDQLTRWHHAPVLRDPDLPDFSTLPPGTKQQFECRIDRLPVPRVRTRIDVDAIMRNEMRFQRDFSSDQAMTRSDAAALRTWHLRSVYDRLSAARPDLVRPDLVRPRATFGGPLVRRYPESFADRVRCG